MRISLLFLLLQSSLVYSAILPTPLPDDYRITEVKYNPNNVIKVRTAIGVNTLIQLEDGETILTPSAGMGMGDIEAWGIDFKMNNLFLKPIADNPDSNLNIVTSKHRTYSFLLELSDYPHFIVRMSYDKPKSSKDFDNRIPCSDGSMNFSYVKWGDQSLSPEYMWDDGRFTCLKFSNKNELPVAYQIASDGTESLINYHVQKDTMILQGISKEFRLRLGKQVLGLKSDDVLSSGYNDKASSVDARREIKSE
ncbi:TrbG/VirB9 family P-type conjugative transfer protein [Vibrio fluvialis]|uniref:TrbG/VirB9 family P-type conjugative transfer protein n=1 Tax=Vibrio fluvialis TaxID=676 RepID=UPI003999CA29